MRKKNDEITNLIAWVKNKKDEGRAEWAIGYLRDRGYPDYPEIEDPLERLLQVVATEANYPRFEGDMDAMKQARRNQNAEKNRADVLVPLRTLVTRQQKESLIKMANENRETQSEANARLIDEAGQAQAKAEQRVAGRYKAKLEKMKSRVQVLEQSMAKGTLPMLLRGRLASDLMALKESHYQLEVMALQWLRDLCQCHVQMNSAGTRAPLLPEQLAAAEAMYNSTVESLHFLGKPPELNLQLQQLLDLGEMDFIQSQQLASDKLDKQAAEKKKRKPRKNVAAQANTFTEEAAGVEGPALPEGIVSAGGLVPLEDAAHVEDSVLPEVAEQVKDQASSTEVVLAENPVQPRVTEETIQLPLWLDEEHRTLMRLASPNGCIDIGVLFQAKKAVRKKDKVSHLDFNPTPEQVKRIVDSYLSRIAKP